MGRPQFPNSIEADFDHTYFSDVDANKSMDFLAILKIFLGLPAFKLAVGNVLMFFIFEQYFAHSLQAHTSPS
jgi:hypothetical protein